MFRNRNQLSGLAILTGDSPILDVAREVSAIITAAQIEAAVIGGVAVVLHGHIRTTLDVDIYTSQSERLAAALEAADFTYDKSTRQFEKHGVPVQLVTPQQAPDPPAQYIDVDDIRTVSLADLITIKLRSGNENVLRAQDLADVIGLIRHHQLRGDFVPKVPKDLRPSLRKLLKAVRDEGR